jgi:hypothetical protein
VTETEGRSIEGIFGYPDYWKFHSCMTLFLRAAGDDETFIAPTKKYLNSGLDGPTINRLRPQCVEHSPPAVCGNPHRYFRQNLFQRDDLQHIIAARMEQILAP